MIETINPKDEKEWLELRKKDVTSSEVAALFGLSPYITAFELWHRKKNATVVGVEWNDPMSWGVRLQDSIAAGVAEDNGWNIRKMTEYMRDPELRMGSSFDFSIEVSGTLTDTCGILEIKNVFGMVFKDQWNENEDGSVEAPPHIELQVQHQLAVSGRSFAYIAALVSGNKVVLIKRGPDASIIDAIKSKVRAFWDSIDSNSPPPPNFAADAEFISKLYGYSEPGKIFNASGDEEITTLAESYKKCSDVIKKATSEKESIKAKLLTIIGDAEKVTADGFSISAGMVGPAHIEYDREGYRTFKINWPRKNKE